MGPTLPELDVGLIKSECTPPDPKLDVRLIENACVGCNLLVPIHFNSLARPVLAVVDTAAQVSMVQDTLLELPPVRNISINTAQVNCAMLCGVLDPVTFDITGNNFQHPFVSGPISDPCILGLDFLLQHNAVVDLSDSTLTLDGQKIDIHVHRSNCGDHRVSRVHVAEKTVIPPQSRQLVPVRLSNPACIPFVTTPQVTDCWMVSSCLLDGGDVGCVEVINDTSWPITFHCNQLIAHAMELQEVLLPNSSPSTLPSCELGAVRPPFPSPISPVPKSAVGHTITPSTPRCRRVSASCPPPDSRSDDVSDDPLDWQTIDQINNVGPTVGTSFLPPSNCPERELRELLQCASDELPAHLLPLFTDACARLEIREQIAIARLLTVYADTFSCGSMDLGIFTLLKHRIRTYNEEPVRERLRRTPLKFQAEEETTLNNMLSAGVIEPSFSEWASAPVLVRKRDGEVRYTVDFRQLNVKTRKDAYPLPLIDECTDTLAGNLWFHTLDLASGYWQIAVHPKDKHKTAFLTKYGLFQHVRMAQGLCNAPATFQRVMHLVLRGLTWDKVLVYLDDVIILGRSYEESLINLELVLLRFRAHGLKLKPKKCSLFCSEVRFLGRSVSRDGVAITNAHVQCVLDWPSPRNIKELEKFLGFVNYHRDFVPNMAEILSPITQLTKKSVPFYWSPACEEAFEQLKSIMASPPVLAYPNNEDPYVLDTDASGVSVAAALYQLQNGREKPISFASLTLTPSQRKYCTTRQELLAVVVFTRRFRHYLLGRHFTVRTDHGSLAWLCRFKNPTGQLGRWLEELSQYDMSIEHRPGTKHLNADGLSRIPDVSPSCDCYVAGADLASLPCGGCPYCQRLHTQWARFDSDVDYVSPLLVRQSSIPTVGSRPDDDVHVTPPYPSNYLAQYQPSDLRELQRRDQELRPILSWLENGEPSNDVLMSEGFVTKHLWRHRDNLRLSDGVLYYRWFLSDSHRDCLVVPLKGREDIIQQLHDTPVGGHWGRDKTLHLLSQRFYWPTMKRDVELFIASCLTCSKNKYQLKPRAPLLSFQAGCPGERVHMDILGPFTTSSSGNRYVLSIVDQFTKWLELCPLPEQSAEATAQAALNSWIVRFGVPRIIHTDQGRNFESHLFGELCSRLQAAKTRTTPYHPRSNGQVERYNQQIASYVRCFLAGKTDTWDTHLPLLGMSLRATVSRVTGFTPNMLMLGHEVNLPSDVLFGIPQGEPQTANTHVKDLLLKMSSIFATTRERMKSSQRRSKQYYDMQAPLRHHLFEPGDLVMVTNSATTAGVSRKLQPLWKGPFVVTQVVSPVLYRVSGQRRATVQHHDRLRPFHERSVPLWVHRKRASLDQNSRSDTLPLPLAAGVGLHDSLDSPPSDPLADVHQLFSLPSCSTDPSSPSPYESSSDELWRPATTRAGRTTRMPSRLRDNFLS